MHKKFNLTRPRSHSRPHGFSLIELMIVIAIIGVLTTLAVPQYQRYIQKSALTVAISNLSALKSSIEVHIASHGDFPSTTANDQAGFSQLGTFEQLGEGTLSVAINTSQDRGDGQLTLDIQQGAVSGEKVRLSRQSNGQWQCKTTAKAEIVPNSCNPAEVIN